jgi:hypothetical protein
MNISYTHYLVEQQRRQDEIKAAEMYRLVKQAKNELSASPALNPYQRLLSVLVLKMVQWGKRLQNLYPAWRKDTISENPC